MPFSHPPIFWTRDSAGAVNGSQALVLLADLDDPTLGPLTSLLPTPEDLARAATYPDARRGYFLARRALLRQLVARRFGCAAEAVVISVDESGAPRIASPNEISPDANLRLSISRRGALVALAIAPRPIGVDVEILGRPEEVPAAMLHKDEAERLADLNGAARHKAFLEIWTLKEAYLKALRTGLRREPAEIEVRWEDGQIRLFDRERPVATTACDSRCEMLGAETIIAACVLL